VEPLAEAFCWVHELHYQTKAREDGLHENFGCYNFAYRKDMKTPVVSYCNEGLGARILGQPSISNIKEMGYAEA
jgi:hypothetical protein